MLPGDCQSLLHQFLSRRRVTSLEGNPTQTDETMVRSSFVSDLLSQGQSVLQHVLSDGEFTLKGHGHAKNGTRMDRIMPVPQDRVARRRVLKVGASGPQAVFIEGNSANKTEGVGLAQLVADVATNG
jgi:hypothetical protein